jgi:8-oxo-dGTP diphosphatase
MVVRPMQLYMVRHAHAGQRSHDGRDIYRPLSPDGNARADELVKIFDGLSIDRIVSSLATRCSQTVAPLAADRAMEVEELQALWEGSSIDEARTAMEALHGQSVVACSHGDIIPSLIESVGGMGAAISGRGCELGSIWIMEFADGRWQSARYVSSREQALA